MDTVETKNNFAKQGQEFTDKTADKLQTGIGAARDAVTQAGDQLSNKIESARSNAGPVLGKAAAQAQSIAADAQSSFSAATDKVRATVSDVGDSVVAYTQDNPVKAILISAAVGAVLATLITSLSRSSD